MGFYKNAGGIKEYTIENIEDEDIPLDTFFIFKESELHSGVVLKCIEKDAKEKDAKYTCKNCFFKDDMMNNYCPACLPGERKDGKYVLYQMP